MCVCIILILVYNLAKWGSLSFSYISENVTQIWIKDACSDVN